MRADKELEIIIPIPIDDYWSDDCEMITNKIIEIHQKFGFKIFLLSAPCNGWSNFEYPTTEFFIQKAHFFKQIKENVAPYGIQCGWWYFGTITGGLSSEIGHMVDKNGVVVENRECTLDPVFIEKFTNNIATFAKIAKPAFIFNEDDFCMFEGCFCDRHLEAFAKRMGRYYSREELKEINTGKPDTLDILIAWREFSKDTLVDLAKEVRKALDKESPEIPMGVFQSGGTDLEGHSTEELCRAHAGSQHTPFSRLYGAFYCGFDNDTLPDMLFHPLYSKQHIKGDFKYLHESDTYPYSRFFNSAGQMRTMMGMVYSYGYDGSVFFAVPFTDCPSEEYAFVEMFSNERKRFNAVSRIARRCRMKGVELCYEPLFHSLERTSTWVNLLGMFGIPYTTENANVAFWDYVKAKYADHDTIMGYLSKGLVLDGDAAKVLCERGYGEYLGVDMGEEVTVGTGEFDQCSQEIIREPFVHFGKGKGMPNARTWCPNGNGRLLKIVPINENCEVLTELYNMKKEFLSVAMTRFENSLGGRIVIMGTTLKNNRSQCLFNYPRQRLLQDMVKWCSDEYAHVKLTPRVNCIMNEAEDESYDFIGMLTLVNLCPDNLKNVAVYLPEKWRHAKELYTLNIDGEWELLDYSWTEDGFVVNGDLNYNDPLYILAKK